MAGAIFGRPMATFVELGQLSFATGRPQFFLRV
jgi:hypothetical protein